MPSVHPHLKRPHNPRQITPKTNAHLPIIRILHRQRPKSPYQPHPLQRSPHNLKSLRSSLHRLQPRIVIDHPIPLLPIHYKESRPLLKEPTTLTIHKPSQPAHLHPRGRSSRHQRRPKRQHPTRNRNHPPNIQRNPPHIINIAAHIRRSPHISPAHATPHKPHLPRVVHIHSNQIPHSKSRSSRSPHIQRSSRRTRHQRNWSSSNSTTPIRRRATSR